MMTSLARRAAAEFLGTGFLVAAVVGSGIMGERLANGNAAIALLANTIATGAALVALIITFGPVSGAHFNPVITFAEALERRFSWSEVPLYLLGQIFGGVGGAVAGNLMFGLPAISISARVRSGRAQLLSEFIATFGLVCVVWASARHRPRVVPFAVGAYITAAYWFTASTSFANPAVTLARSFSNTFSGIRPGDVPAFIAVQFLGGVASVLVLRYLFSESVKVQSERVSS